LSVNAPAGETAAATVVPTTEAVIAGNVPTTDAEPVSAPTARAVEVEAPASVT
jgi:hypothetical protein